MNRVYRKLASWFGIAAVVFAQVALSAYACPMALQSVGETTRQVSESAVVMDTSGFASTVLCKKHCENEQQNLNDAPQAAASISLEPLIVVLPVITPTMSLHATAFARSLLHTTSPPASIRNCCFRI